MRRLVLVLALAACTTRPTRGPRTQVASDDRRDDTGRTTIVALADHHVHAFSPPVRQWLQDELGLPPLPTLGAEELATVLREEHVTKAAVLSNAYFFAHDTAKHPHDAGEFVAENDRVASAIARHPEQLVGFFSVDPLAGSAFDEIERCGRSKRFVGLKLHLANSEVDLRDAAHVERLAEVFARANALRLAVVIHLRTQRPDYGREDADSFIERVLPKAPDVVVQVAHVAGWGGYDPPTDAALSAFVERRARTPTPSDHVYFDLSAVVRVARGATNGPDWFPARRYERLVERLRALGLDRVWFGTDWPDWKPRAYAADLEKNLPLDGKELGTIFSNRAPWLALAP